MRSTLFGLALGVALCAGGAGAQALDEDRRFLEDRFTVTIGGGIDGWTGTLADRLNPGAVWGATVGVQPLSFMGAEIGYTGSVFEVDQAIAASPDRAVDGADFVRNGGQVAVTFNAPTPIVQPYVLGGIGLDRYSFRGTDTELLRDDTAGRIPVGAGIRGTFAGLVADARFSYDMLFSQQFARLDENDNIGGAYTGTLNIGARF